ncbi:MAG: hypothetical protein QNL92_00480, partial [Octadecabacter sp.]
DCVTTLNNLRHSAPLKLIRKPNSFVHIRLSLVPKLPSKASTNLGAPHTYYCEFEALAKSWATKEERRHI